MTRCVGMGRQIDCLTVEGGAADEPLPACRNVGLQSRQPGPQTSQPPPLLVNLLTPTLFLSLSNPPLRSSNSALQTIHTPLLRRPHRRHLAVQRHPHRYPVPLDVLALQQYRQPFCRNVGKQLSLHLTVKLGVGRQRRIAASPSMSS